MVAYICMKTSIMEVQELTHHCKMPYWQISSFEHSTECISPKTTWIKWGPWDQISSFPLSPPPSLTHPFSTLRGPSPVDLFPALIRFHLRCAGVARPHHLLELWTSKIRFSFPHASTLASAYIKTTAWLLCVLNKIFSWFPCTLHQHPLSSPSST